MNAVSCNKENGKLESVPVNMDGCACSNTNRQIIK